MTRSVARRKLARIAVTLPAVTVLLVDLFHRRASYGAMIHEDLVALSITWALSAALWTCAMIASTRRRGFVRWIALAVLALLGAANALQAAAYLYFATTIDFHLLQSSWQLEGMGAVAGPFIATITRWMFAGAFVAIAYALLVRRIARPKRTTARRASAAMAGLLVVAFTATTYLPRSSSDAAPDVLALGAVGRFVLERPKRAPTAKWYALPEVQFPRTVPPIPPTEPRHPRNVLFVLTESIRASAVCAAPGHGCEHNPFSNEALPDRIPFERMRALDSATLLSFGIMFSGIAVDAPKNDWLTAPLLFDYAHAAGISTAYVSAQHPNFAGSHAWTDNEPIDRLAWGTDFDEHADKMLGADDAAVVERTISELPRLHEPFFAVVHYSGTHYPYWIDSDAPFRPISAGLDPQNPAPLRNRYFDAIYRQDKLTANLVKALRAMPMGRRTVIVYISDHGESFYEHEAGLHGSSLYESELRVPAWIDAPNGVLTSEELRSLRAQRDSPITQADIAPTILDLLGIYGVAAWKDFMAHMVGTSLLRWPVRERTTSIATCNELWPCFVPVTGQLIGDRKWVKRKPTAARCFDTLADPEEKHDLGPAACGQ